MLDPYKLSLINTLLFCVFLIFIFFIRKKKRFFFIFLLGSSCLPLVSLLRKGVHQSGDFAINISKSMDLYNSLTYGIFPVHWASLLNATYGYPLFLFTYPLPYYSITFFKFLGFSFIASEKLIIAAVFLLSGIGMYILLKHFLKPPHSLLGAILYLFAPYHLVDMHYRVALGELFAYAALPFVFAYIFKLTNKFKRQSFIILIISYTALILSHQAIALITAPLILITPFFLKPKLKKVLPIYAALLLALLLSTFYWLPVLEGIQYTHQISFSKDISFENPLLYIYSPWRYGLLYQGPIGQLSFPIGIIQLSLFLWGFVLILKGKFVGKFKSLLLILLFILLGLIFMLLPISKLLWKFLPLMTNFQFSYRLMLPISFFIAIFSAIVSTKIKSGKVVYLFILIAIGSTILNWGTRATIPDITDQNLLGRVPTSTAEGEGLQPAAPKWRNINQIWVNKPPEKNIEIENGKGILSTVLRTPTLHTYRATIESNSKIVENTFYFPGWNLYVNGMKHKFRYIDPNKTNLIRFNLVPGTYDISLKYEQTEVVKFSNLISISTLIGIMTYFLMPIFHKSR